ncbi:hypothetical protein JVT61DRAFT_5332 [Boletus reticuloceps]|uniref:RING-type domain-containing protein n=1 Tax=Boletus reticuloceps TaxID=495285 RepID=A0A8I2YZJ1_9AGAM|nr:hypothetical protein JVT61DRAFT_5332 [Boletus reticuloceps]
MSAREPLWFCHEVGLSCQTPRQIQLTSITVSCRDAATDDTRPYMRLCRGSFVERLENPSDDPRDFHNRAPNVFDMPNDLPGAFEGLFRSGLSPLALIKHRPYSSPLGPRRSSDNFATHSSPPRSPSPPTRRAQDNSTSTGLHFEFHSGPGGGTTRTFILGGPDTLGRSQPQPDRPVPTIFEFLRRESENTNNMRTPGDINGPLMAQYLLALFGREPHGNGDPFAELLGMPASARWGDYVFNQEGWSLDQILTQLAENSTAGRPAPATEEIINNLPKQVLTEGSPLLEGDCAVCKESFKLDAEDPDELLVITLPCKHPFHESCILPWLKSSGTCPVCRFALVPQPQQHSPGGPSGGSSSSSRANPSSGSGPRSPGNSSRRGGGGGGGGFFHALFGGGAGTSGGSSDAYSTQSRNLGRGRRNVHPEVVSRSTPSFPGQWIEDID